MNYNYNFNSKRSIGVSLSWLGIHIDEYMMYNGYHRPFDTVDDRGWNHYFTLLGNYRKTYYRKNGISLYWGIYLGATLCVRDKDILPKETIIFFLGQLSNARYFFDSSVHLSAFGIDIGEKHILNMELGIGTLGIFNAGYKYKF